MSADTDVWLLKRDQCTAGLVASPYDAGIYLERARCHGELQYPDLAVGDAYKALILTDEVLDEAGEYHELSRLLNDLLKMYESRMPAEAKDI